ncbi:MAG TPA: TonB family protein [Polyangiaceae bacterium]|nr:TonB family protein [Polyangiaceae bacterium]
MRHITLTALASSALFWTLSSQAQTPAPEAPAPSTPATTSEAAAADDAASATAPTANAAPRMTPPRLLESVEPVYPEAARQSRQTASVGLVLTLDTEGHVVDAAVTESAGADFDASALEAARRLVFSPALHGETPIAAKIPYRFEFSLAAEPPPPPPPVEVAPAPAPEPLPPTAAADSLDIEVEGERPPREPTRRVLAAEEITKIPGTNGDALRGVLNLPGIAQPGPFEGLLIVRGSSPNDSLVFVDSMQVPIVYHFGGLSSVIPSEMLERIDFYPGNFGPEFGRASGGMVDVGVRSPKKEGYGGLLQFDLLDGRLLAEGALSDDTRVMIAGRRSWVDAWLGPALESTGSNVRTAPVYYDAQAMIEHDVSDDTTLRLFAYGSDDRLALLVESPDSGDPAAGGDVSLHTGFWRVQGRAETRFSSKTRWTTTLAAGRDIQDFSIGNLDLDIRLNTLDARTEVRSQILPELTLAGGLDITSGTYDVSWRLPAVDFESNDDAGPLFGRPVTELSGTGEMFRPSAYVLAEVTPLKGLKLLPGVRVDYTHDTEDFTADPRIGFRYDLYPSELRTTIKGGVGVFHKPPEPYESIEPFGTPGIGSERAIHYSLGFEQELSQPLEVSLEGFYKDLDQLAIATADALGSESGQRWTNDGIGRSYGAELLLRYKPVDRFFGWVAYTLSRSERRNPGEDWERFDYDQTHILTALGSYKLGRGWQLGARFRYITGRPYTPYLGGVVDYDAGVYSPLQGSEQNGARLPARHQLDLRVDKEWQFASWKLGAYLDVQNVYNRENTEDIGYNYDFSENKPVPGLPILPILGIRGEL